MRVFKNKWFNRWARDEKISDAVLYKAAEEVVTGKVEADLGGSLFKKRIARTGAGKSAGYRTIVGYRKPNSERIVIFMLFPKTKGQIFQKKKRLL